jgi:cysteine synthase
LCVAEQEGGAFAVGWKARDRSAVATRTTLIEGIGRPRVEPGFLFETVDEVLEVPDEASIAAMQLLGDLLGRRYGGSSGTNLVACLVLAARMRAAGERGSIVSLLGDRGDRYDRTLFDPGWLGMRGVDTRSARQSLRATWETGRWHAIQAGRPAMA